MVIATKEATSGNNCHNELAELRAHQEFCNRLPSFLQGGVAKPGWSFPFFKEEYSRCPREGGGHFLFRRGDRLNEANAECNQG